jgi:hypothetical protein
VLQTEVCPANTHGRCLQELLAPNYLVFYSRGWCYLGTKTHLRKMISGITRIDVETLADGNLEKVSVAQKMSWAAYRQTTRVEDMAYCLLGIFDVNMPLLYGEGTKAFLRLQEEIMKVTNDHSLFAWGAPQKMQSMDYYDKQVVPSHRSCKIGLQNKLCKIDDFHEGRLEGLLPDSPAEFADCNNITSLQDWPADIDNPPILTYRGVRVELPCIPGTRSKGYPWHRFSADRQVREAWEEESAPLYVVLGCRVEQDYNNLIGLVLAPWSRNAYGRLEEPILIPVDKAASPTKVVHVKQEKPVQRLGGCFIIRALPVQGCELARVNCRPRAHYTERARIITPYDKSPGPQAALIFHQDNKPVFAVVLGTKGAKGTKYTEDSFAPEPFLNVVLLEQATIKDSDEDMPDITTPGLHASRDDLPMKMEDILSPFISRRVIGPSSKPRRLGLVVTLETRSPNPRESTKPGKSSTVVHFISVELDIEAGTPAEFGTRTDNPWRSHWWI